MTSTNMAGAEASEREVWLVCVGSDELLAPRLLDFAPTPAALLLAVNEPACQRWAAAFARQNGAPCERLAGHAPEDVLAELAARMQPGRILVCLPAVTLRETLVLALELPRERARQVRIDEGRAALLRDDGAGFVLRHTNVLGPEREPGTGLPRARTGA